MERNIQALRDEMLELGPYAYEELSYEAAVERMSPVWKRRFGVDTEIDVEPLDLPSEVEGELFRITQEAVTNAGKHGQARHVHISLARGNGGIELIVRDDGGGLEGRRSARLDRAGAHRRGRACASATELLGGEMTIRSTETRDGRARAQPAAGRLG